MEPQQCCGKSLYKARRPLTPLDIIAHLLPLLSRVSNSTRTNPLKPPKFNLYLLPLKTLMQHDLTRFNRLGKESA
ncbi:hypothetical protein L1987_83192 [Smallanthus sonchifolius]|uniref:Uncharacterized protein n=1 Tax=Smallanthus sonchifolius TaxID=185202 RepID=A0ACB8YB21_9ASTR|nr:hypothetical protein L1987_83192 [Smallanthus sonchifolius]